MKLKTKLTSLCIAFVFVLSMLMVGVWAVRETNFEIGGNIVFKAKGIEATIANAALSGASFTDGSTIDSKFNDITIDEDTAEDDLTADYNTWQNLALQFDESVATLKFTVTNTKPETKDYPYMSVDVSVSSTSITNADVVVSNSNGGSKIYLASGESADYTITFYLNDNTLDASVEGFTINFAMERMLTNPTESTVQLSYDETGNYYYVTMGTYTISEVATDIRWRLVSFDGETRFEATKSTPPTMYTAISGDTAYKNVTFIQETYTGITRDFHSDSSIATANDYASSDVRSYLRGTTATFTDYSGNTENTFITDLSISTSNTVYQKITERSCKDVTSDTNTLYKDINWRIDDSYQVEDGTPQTSTTTTDKFWLMSIKELYTLLGGGRVVNDKITPSRWSQDVKNSIKWRVNVSDEYGVLYWLRSPNPEITNGAFYIHNQGAWGGSLVENATMRVRPAFNLNF